MLPERKHLDVAYGVLPLSYHGPRRSICRTLCIGIETCNAPFGPRQAGVGDRECRLASSLFPVFVSCMSNRHK